MLHRIHKAAALVLAAVLLLCVLSPCLGGCSKNPLEYTVAEGGKSRILSKCDPSAEEIVIPEKYRGLPVTAIGKGAFSGCTKLTAIEIPANITTIADDAFYGCSGLTELIVPETVTSIGIGAFTNCKKLRTITLPSNMTELPDYLFMGDVSLESLVIPSGVTRIGEQAFYNCQGLVSVDIPSGVTEIGKNAFIDCAKLENISLPDGLTTIGVAILNGTAFANNPENWTGNALINGKWLLDVDGTAAGEFEIPAGVTYIASFAFSGCKELTSVTIPEGVTFLGDNVFADCKKLAAVTLPSTLKTIPERTFYKCEELSVIELGGTEEIGKNAFVGCKMLQHLTIPASVRRIAPSAFNSGVGLVGVTFAVTSGWSVRTEDGSSTGTLGDTLLETPERAASLLAYDYNGHEWFRK